MFLFDHVVQIYHTHVVVSVFHQERYPLPHNASLIFARLFQQALFRRRDVLEYMGVCELVASIVVDDRNRLRVMGLHGLKEGRAL